MRFIQIPWQSELYNEEVALRDRLLRAPLDLEFSDWDLQQESSQLHFGILDEDQRLIACLVIVPLPDQHAKLRQMVVDDRHQRTGLGTRLIDSVQQELVSRGFRSVELSARSGAVGFYERQGFEKCGDEFIEVGIPHWKMTKNLS